mgnify:CR=1 FL=1
MLDKFQDLGVDAIVGSEVMQLTGVTPDDLQDAMIFSRVKDVMDYVKKLPNRGHFISKALIGKNVDKLSHLWGYVELHKRKEEALKGLKEIDEEIGYYEK